ncbi:hypothetical protein HBB16_14300 [Pseudonocardia sp. MCCB 268]|nr:hypothetical protein [Pseudonocardia cytotoxica]
MAAHARGAAGSSRTARFTRVWPRSGFCARHRAISRAGTQVEVSGSRPETVIAGTPGSQVADDPRRQRRPVRGAGHRSGRALVPDVPLGGRRPGRRTVGQTAATGHRR